MSETPPPSRFRIRWGWFVGCIVLGLTAILIGWFVASANDCLARYRSKKWINNLAAQVEGI